MQSFSAKAHGRVNLIGEHTDYNGGWVLPTPIPQFTTCRVTREPGHVARARSNSGQAPASWNLGEEERSGKWTDYLEGATSILRRAGHPLEGFGVSVESTVPIGSGLSSSAALTVSFLKALRSAFNLPLTDVEVALLAQRVENEFVGARVGIMDQMSCSLAEPGEALYLDTETLTFEKIPLSWKEADLLVVNSGISHRNVDGGYNRRREECETACELLGIKSLRAVKAVSELAALPDPFRRRAEHVFHENERVHHAVGSLRRGDFRALGAIFSASHASMRDAYEISIPEIDLLVGLFARHPRAYGARLTGGGFGGSIVALTESGAGLACAEELLPVYEKQTGRKPTLLLS